MGLLLKRIMRITFLQQRQVHACWNLLLYTTHIIAIPPTAHYIPFFRRASIWFVTVLYAFRRPIPGKPGAHIIIGTQYYICGGTLWYPKIGKRLGTVHCTQTVV